MFLPLSSIPKPFIHPLLEALLSILLKTSITRTKQTNKKRDNESPCLSPLWDLKNLLDSHLLRLKSYGRNASSNPLDAFFTKLHLPHNVKKKRPINMVT